MYHANSPFQNFAVLIFAKSAWARKAQIFAPCENSPLYSNWLNEVVEYKNVCVGLCSPNAVAFTSFKPLIVWSGINRYDVSLVLNH